MNDEYYNEPEELSSMGNFIVNPVDENAETFEVNGEIISDRLKQLFQKAEQQKISKKSDDILENLGPTIKTFVTDLIKFIDYRDIAEIIGMEPDKLKESLEKHGIKAPADNIRHWEDIDFGTFRSIELCSKCQVQQNHHSFLVGIRECRKCIEENIRHWMKNGEPINLKLYEK